MFQPDREASARLHLAERAVMCPAPNRDSHIFLVCLAFGVSYAEPQNVRAIGELGGIKHHVSATVVEMVLVTYVSVTQHAIDKELGFHRAHIINDRPQRTQPACLSLLHLRSVAVSTATGGASAFTVILKDCVAFGITPLDA